MRLDREAQQLRVSVAPWDSSFYAGSAPEWTVRNDLQCTVERVSGYEPSRATLYSHANPESLQGNVIVSEAVGAREHVTRLPCGELDGPVPAPFGISEYDFVKVESAPDQGGQMEVIFLGLVTGWRWDLSRSRMAVICQDYRWLLQRIRCKVSQWRRPAGEDTVEILDLCHFNAGGLPDQEILSDGTRNSFWITPQFNLKNGAQVDVAKAYAGYWTPGDALNALSYMFVTTPSSQVDSCENWLIWPQIERDGDQAYLFADPDSEDERRMMDADFSGRDLCYAIDYCVRAAGPYNWTLEYAVDGIEKARIKIFPIRSEDHDGDLRLPIPGSAMQSSEPEVSNVAIELDWSRAHKKVRAVGARKRFDLSLDSDPAGDNKLTEAWSSAEASAWLADTKSRLYPDAFLVWAAADDLDWAAFFGNDYCERVRVALARLATQVYDQTAADDRPINLSIRVWRLKAGEWEMLPDAIAVMPLPDRVGFRLGPNARQLAKLTDSVYSVEEVWSYDTSTKAAYPMRVTLSVEADERLFQVEEDDALDWPPGELYLPAGNRYRYEARRSCTLRWDGTNPVASGGTEDHEFGAAADDVIRDDTDEIGALADRKLADAARPQMGGTITLIGIRSDVGPGWVLGELQGGEGPSGTAMPSMQVHQAVRRVIYDGEEQSTVISF